MRQSRTSGSEGGRDEQSPGLPDPTPGVGARPPTTNPGGAPHGGGGAFYGRGLYKKNPTHKKHPPHPWNTPHGRFMVPPPPPRGWVKSVGRYWVNLLGH